MAKPSRSVLNFGGALGLLSFNLFCLSPWVSQTWGAFFGNGAYVTLRLLTLVGYSFISSLYLQRKRVEVIRSTCFLVFVEQVLLKTLVLWQDAQAHPQGWEGIQIEAAGFGLLMSYVISIPFIVILSFAGTELKDLFPKLSAKHAQPVS
jgi:hypothetical protein